MIKNKLMPLIFIPFLLLTACSRANETTEDIIWGDINTEIDYTENNIDLPSAVDRKEKIDIHDYFIKIPISITQEKIESMLPDIYGNNHKIERIWLNNVAFDINEIANMSNYDSYISDGIFKMDIPWTEDSFIQIEVAQIASGDTYKLDEESNRLLNNIILEYREIYENTQNQVSGEYGNYYTYSEYVNFLNDNEDLKKDITVYDNDQILDLIFEIFDMTGYEKSDFLASDNGSLLEYSTWYEVTNNFYSAKDANYAMVLSVRRNNSGVFVTKVKYPYNCTIDNTTGKDYYTPSMIINFSQNNYQQLAESYEKYVERTN